jgi:hypothetical protein
MNRRELLKALSAATMLNALSSLGMAKPTVGEFDVVSKDMNDLASQLGV